ncbi:hypothetical protein AWENTII_000685 [Aspergillus wentii]
MVAFQSTIVIPAIMGRWRTSASKKQHIKLPQRDWSGDSPGRGVETALDEEWRLPWNEAVDESGEG